MFIIILVNNHQAKVLFFFTKIVFFYYIIFEFTLLLMVRSRYSENYIAMISCTWEWAITFMWRRPLNSVALVAVTHRRLGKVSNGTSTRVETCMINKWRAMNRQKRLYNVRDPPKNGGIWKKLKNTIIQGTEIGGEICSYLFFCKRD